MQVKTINAVIRKKLDDWLSSITDTVLQKQVRESLLLSGGAITNMFMNIEVNDYDIYIQDPNVLFKLCTYYKNILPDKHDKECIEIFDGTDEKFYENRMKEFSEEDREIGLLVENEKRISKRKSALKNLKPNQIKFHLAVATGGLKIEYKEDYIKDKKYLPVYFTPNAISLTNDIQIVVRFSGTVEEIHKSFDYIHATNYFTYKDGLVLNTNALSSIISKELMYQGSRYPVTSIIRMKKFLKRGWNISAGEILKICMQISELNLHDVEVLEDQLIGVDVAYFSTLISAISNIKDTSKVNAEYISSIIDNIFKNTPMEESEEPKETSVSVNNHKVVSDELDFLTDVFINQVSGELL